MSAKADSSSSGIDTVKLVLAITVLVGGIVGYYHFADKSLIYRVLGVLLSVFLSMGMVLTTQLGRQFLGFLVEARVEVRKVVWPNRQETVQSTLVVVALVFLVGLILWTLDAGLFWGISRLTGQGN
ncbi:MAG: preprotein translocase subunit SecE [Gammaproteobacteria bacterium]|jgi:preprotein translocase subunit SecE|nr:preprotein translocase subunit SecE [Gammaproteobacteria bacterium]NBT45174.1 preprotein translocase subunit SecE [Gammaproteobacteria bacterium]NBY22583.1 preprotein translocase subunit SecE [Gammaproteobacteria bacterium]NDE35741.1 preprotein translocase subunit SecE [Gammaproteobacteria bacterium]NDE57697.1 preprotein translocase subunit SecE [Gammaproteobacteria bacterium]